MKTQEHNAEYWWGIIVRMQSISITDSFPNSSRMWRYVLLLVNPSQLAARFAMSFGFFLVISQKSRCFDDTHTPLKQSGQILRLPYFIWQRQISFLITNLAVWCPTWNGIFIANYLEPTIRGNQSSRAPRRRRSPFTFSPGKIAMLSNNVCILLHIRPFEFWIIYFSLNLYM